MAEECVRKSGRNKVRNTSYLDDDFDYNLGKFDQEEASIPKAKKRKTAKQNSQDKPNTNTKDKPATKDKSDIKKSPPVKIKVEPGLQGKVSTEVTGSYTKTNNLLGTNETLHDLDQPEVKGEAQEDKSGVMVNGLTCPLCAQQVETCLHIFVISQFW